MTMKMPKTSLAVLAFALIISFGTANVSFTFVQPSCNDFLDTGLKGCLSGQTCLSNNTCVPSRYLENDTSASTSSTLAARDARGDGRCGGDLDGALCDAEGEYGGCCSAMGWCGKTDDHCTTVNGCQSGCADGGAVTSISPPAPTSPAVPDFTTPSVVLPGQGEPLSEPVFGRTSTSQPTDAVTKDGTCGANNDDTLCGDYVLGGCCSMYGYCGSTSGFCGEGCQSGPCEKAPAASVPVPSPAPANANPGSFEVVGRSGVPAMHTALMPNGRVVFLDKVEDYTQSKLQNGQFAYSAEYDPETNEVMPLAYKTNAFCSGGAFLANGTLLNIGGNGPLDWLDPTISDGFDGLRYLTRSATDVSLDGEAWIEPGNKLDTPRWYASAQTLADGTIFVASGSLNGLDPSKPTNNNPTYELLDATGRIAGGSIPMDLLVEAQPYHMYPFLHLLPTGDLFVFASKISSLFNPSTNTTTATLPELPGSYRTYPNSGTSVLLPLHASNDFNPEVLICGGGSYQDLTSPTDASCGRISPFAADPTWEMDSMPIGRGSPDALNLPDGTVLFLNGYSAGAQGFLLATDPVLEALLYDARANWGERWSTVGKSEIARMYHSVAVLLMDGRVLVAGSNANEMPVLEPTADAPFETEFRVEIYTPPYLSGGNAQKRPTDIVLETTNLRADGSTFEVRFIVVQDAKAISVVLYHGGFVTHAVHMGQRMVVLGVEGFVAGETGQQVRATMPESGNVVPPGPYVVFVTVDGVPGVGQTVMVS